MNFTHPEGKVHLRDGEYQARLIEELAKDLGNRLKGICEVKYHGNRMVHEKYWERIMVTWTGPMIWNKTGPCGLI